MAEIDFNPARKPAVYDYLGRLNAAFARVHSQSIIATLSKTGCRLSASQP